jgi:hypothetical protein
LTELAEKKDSIFKRYENMTPLTVLLVFMVFIVLMQLIGSVNDGGIRYPTFIAPVNIFNIFMQVAVLAALALICFCSFETYRTSKALYWQVYDLYGRVGYIQGYFMPDGQFAKTIDRLDAGVRDIYDAMPNKDADHLMIKRLTRPRLPEFPQK